MQFAEGPARQAGEALRVLHTLQTRIDPAAADQPENAWRHVFTPRRVTGAEHAVPAFTVP
ncbi:hypothetical protein ACFQZ4_43110 [Catellatospora coxensis]|uniref:Uncharacterized protein n=1 Tax=Catellatospora coxensis TaxID=310354 RepID=A0A8J3L3U9_9ACTN|nr:hypothetical protein Cco03nite_82870 [Catellatospora coxensis]